MRRYETAVSALEAFVFQREDSKQLEELICEYGRVLLRGQACKKDTQQQGNVKYTARTDEEVVRILKLLPAQEEFAIRRLKWLQAISEAPENNTQLIAALCARVPFKTTPTVNAQGLLRANPEGAFEANP
jgi:hypothetical protein